MPLKSIVAVALAAAAVLTVGCGGVTSPSQNKMDTFSGTLAIGGRASKSYDVANTGEFAVKITGMSPTTTAVVGLGWYLGANCELRVQETLSQINQPLSGGVFQKGTYCVGIFDVGGLTVAQNFTITVSHP